MDDTHPFRRPPPRVLSHFVAGFLTGVVTSGTLLVVITLSMTVLISWR